MNIVEIIVSTFGIYLAIGVVFAVYFVAFRITKYDATAKNSSIFFRVIIFFGACVLWALLVFQIVQNKDRIEVTAHRL
jgi:prolipoprotein diacylglyceryltransferase